MELRREMTVSFGALVLLNLAFAFGTIGLFARMGPAIDRILQENVSSTTAAEDLLTQLAMAPDGPLGDDARLRSLDALDRLRAHVTLAEETPLLVTIEADLGEFWQGRPEARDRLVASLQALIHINREAMRQADRRARRLGAAGAWTAVVVGSLSALLGLLVLGRVRRRMVMPLVDLHQVLEDAYHGDRFRRSRPCEAPFELSRVIHAVNRLLDERLQESEQSLNDSPALEASTMRLLMDLRPQAVAVLDDHGQLRHANTHALDALAGPRGDEWRARMARLTASGQAEHDGMRCQTLHDGAGWLCLFDDSPPARDSAAPSSTPA